MTFVEVQVVAVGKHFFLTFRLLYKSDKMVDVIMSVKLSGNSAGGCYSNRTVHLRLTVVVGLFFSQPQNYSSCILDSSGDPSL